MLRPVDVPTSAALPGRLAALNVGVASPHAAGVGGDCTETMVTDRTYAAYLGELRAEGVEYLPVVWSACGRPHPDAIRVLVTLARATARRRDTSSYGSLAWQSAARIGAGIWRRAAGMVLACWPDVTVYPRRRRRFGCWKLRLEQGRRGGCVWLRWEPNFDCVY